MELSWEKLFYYFSPYLLEHPNDNEIKKEISKILYDLSEDKKTSGTPIIEDQDFQTIKIHFTSLDLLDVKYLKTTGGGMNLFWNITEKGKKLMSKLRSIKKQL